MLLITADMAVRWGDVPTWLAAIGTVGALFAALWQIRTERKRRLAAEKQLRQERHVEQACRVAAYMGEERRLQGDTAAPRRIRARRRSTWSTTPLSPFTPSSSEWSSSRGLDPAH